MSSLSRTLRLAAFAAVCILATGVAAAASAKEETPSGKRDAAAASLEPRSRELDPKGAARMIASPAIRKAPEAEPVRQAEGARIYVEKAEITETVQKIEAEAKRGDKANPGKLARWLRFLGDMAPDILDVTLACLTKPAGGITEAVRKVANQVREEAKGALPAPTDSTSV